VPKKLWPLPTAPDATATASLTGQETLLAARTNSGVFIGVIAQDRSARGGLVKLSDAGQVGPPSVATANGTELMIAFSWRANAMSPWSIRLARGTSTALPSKATAFTLPPGGSGGDAEAPALMGLSDGRWLLSWIEGPPGKAVLRAVTLSPLGELVGPAIALSRPDQDVEDVALGLAGTNGVATYVAKTKGATELWSMLVACPLVSSTRVDASIQSFDSIVGSNCWVRRSGAIVGSNYWIRRWGTAISRHSHDDRPRLVERTHRSRRSV
jgi:hypothetical protein